MRRGLRFLFGAVGGAALDYIHVRSGVLSYRAPTGLSQPWWVAPQFGVATVAILEGTRWLGPRIERPTSQRVIEDAAWFVASYAASGVVDRRRPRALAAALTVCAVARMTQRRDRAAVVIYAGLLAAAGSIYEHLLAGTGAFAYARPQLGNVPAWLPGLYLQGAPLAVDLAAMSIRG